LQDHPDCTLVFWNTLTRFLQQFPNELTLFHPSSLETLFQKVLLSSLVLNERLAFQSCLDFITTTLRLEESSPCGQMMAQIFESIGCQVCFHLYMGIGGQALSSMIPRISEVLLLISITYPVKFKECTNKWMHQPDFPTAKVSMEEKLEFIKTIMGTRQPKKFKQVVKSFSLKCKGLDNTDFGNSISNI
jgi:hypothetical protein